MSNVTRVGRAKAELRSGDTVTIPFWVVESGRPGPCLLLAAAQHGNEVQGSEAIRRFVEMAEQRMRAGKVIAVPFVNMAAFRQRRPHINMKPEQPYGDARGHNMNGTWPGRKRGNDTARVSYAVYQAVGEEATHCLDLHCWAKFTAPAMIIRDAPGVREIAEGIAPRFVQVRPPANRTLGGLFCSTGRIGMTYEFPGQYTLDPHPLRDGMRVVTNFAKIIGLLSGRPAKGYSPVLFSDETKQTTVKAPCSGLFAQEPLRLCQAVKKGDLLGRLLSDRDLAVREIVAPRDGYLAAFAAHRPNCDVALPSQHPYASKGDTLATIEWME